MITPHHSTIIDGKVIDSATEKGPEGCKRHYLSGGVGYDF
jgi:hypothetical protein